ncbi:MAG: hypothetical protein DMF71_03940 [Acidobacteria bacterium]|nr:MAG: hypothetical protein DMF71_03940 [Acidobacteriota bacterium]
MLRAPDKSLPLEIVMKLRMPARALRFFALAMVVSAAVWQVSINVSAQKTNKPKAAHPATNKAAKPADSKTGPGPNNAEYAAEVKKNTTESYFMTELVDHLPASDKVPSPDKVLGYAIGAPGHLTYTKDMYSYYRELEKSTARVRTFIAPEKSEEGKEQMLVAVGDEAALAHCQARRPTQDYRCGCRATYR